MQTTRREEDISASEKCKTRVEILHRGLRNFQHWNFTRSFIPTSFALSLSSLSSSCPESAGKRSTKMLLKYPKQSQRSGEKRKKEEKSSSARQKIRVGRMLKDKWVLVQSLKTWLNSENVGSNSLWSHHQRKMFEWIKCLIERVKRSCATIWLSDIAVECETMAISSETTSTAVTDDFWLGNFCRLFFFFYALLIADGGEGGRDRMRMENGSPNNKRWREKKKHCRPSWFHPRHPPPLPLEPAEPIQMINCILANARSLACSLSPANHHHSRPLIYQYRFSYIIKNPFQLREWVSSDSSDGKCDGTLDGVVMRVLD